MNSFSTVNLWYKSGGLLPPAGYYASKYIIPIANLITTKILMMSPSISLGFSFFNIYETCESFDFHIFFRHLNPSCQGNSHSKTGFYIQIAAKIKSSERIDNQYKDKR